MCFPRGGRHRGDVGVPVDRQSPEAGPNMYKTKLRSCDVECALQECFSIVIPLSPIRAEWFRADDSALPVRNVLLCITAGLTCNVSDNCGGTFVISACARRVI